MPCIKLTAAYLFQKKYFDNLFAKIIYSFGAIFTKGDNNDYYH